MFSFSPHLSKMYQQAEVFPWKMSQWVILSTRQISHVLLSVLTDYEVSHPQELQAVCLRSMSPVVIMSEITLWIDTNIRALTPVCSIWCECKGSWCDWNTDQETWTTTWSTWHIRNTYIPLGIELSTHLQTAKSDSTEMNVTWNEFGAESRIEVSLIYRHSCDQADFLSCL